MKKGIRRRHKKSAFTLVEVMLAIFVVAMCAGIVAGTMPLSTISRDRASLKDKASGIAQKEEESILGAGYVNANASQLASLGLLDSAAPIATNTYSFSNVGSGTFNSAAQVLPRGVGTVNIQQTDIDLIQIVVTVQYYDTHANAMETVQLGTVIANL